MNHISAGFRTASITAREKYRIECEVKAGEDFVDFIFYPERNGTDGIILELKIDAYPEEVIQHIMFILYLQHGFFGKSICF